LSLFVLGILTDYSDTALAFDNFALFANRFYWWSYFHSNSPFSCMSWLGNIGTPNRVYPGIYL